MVTENRYITAMLDHLDPSAENLRKQANEADRRASAAEQDHDHRDAGKWRQRAIELRRQARAKEFASERTKNGEGE